MNTGAKLGIAAVLIGGAAFGIVNVVKAANAADKLDIDVDAFTLKEVKKNPLGIPTALIYTVGLKLNNPTDKDLVIGKPYIKLSVKKADGTLAKIANTETPEAIETNIKAKSSTSLKHDLELRIFNVATVIPNFVQYIIGRLRGEKSTQQAIADVTLESMGLTLSAQQIINL